MKIIAIPELLDVIDLEGATMTIDDPSEICPIRPIDWTWIRLPAGARGRLKSEAVPSMQIGLNWKSHASKAALAAVLLAAAALTAASYRD